jgi:hypothetical protein
MNELISDFKPLEERDVNKIKIKYIRKMVLLVGIFRLQNYYKSQQFLETESRMVMEVKFKLFALILIMGWLACKNEQRPKINHLYPLTVSNLANVKGCGDTYCLVDEQFKEPVFSFWKPGEDAFCVFDYVDLVLKLDSGNVIQHVYFYAGHDTKIWIYETNDKEEIKLKKGWNTYTPKQDLDGIMVQFPSNIVLGEILVETKNIPLINSTQ